MSVQRWHLLARHPFLADAALATFVAVFTLASDAFSPGTLARPTTLAWDVL